MCQLLLCGAQCLQRVDLWYDAITGSSLDPGNGLTIHTSVSIELLKSWHPTGLWQWRWERFSRPNCILLSQIIISDIQHSRLKQNNQEKICTNKHNAIMNALPSSRQAINTKWLVTQPCRIKSPLRFLTHWRWLTCKQQLPVWSRVSLASPLPPSIQLALSLHSATPAYIKVLCMFPQGESTGLKALSETWACPF